MSIYVATTRALILIRENFLKLSIRILTLKNDALKQELCKERSRDALQ